MKNFRALHNSVPECFFCASASLLRQTANFFTIGGPDGVRGRDHTILRGLL